MTASAGNPLPTPPSPPPSPPKGHVARNWTIAVVVIIGLVGLIVLGAIAINNEDSKGNAFGDATLGSCHHQENARGLVECMITIHNSSHGRAGYVIEAQALRGDTVVGGSIHTIVLEVPRGGTKETTLGGVVDGQWDSVRIISVHRDSVMTNT
jgi:hypothetical protein